MNFLPKLTKSCSSQGLPTDSVCMQYLTVGKQESKTIMNVKRHIVIINT